MVDSLAETYNATDGAPEYSATEWRRAHSGLFIGPSATRVTDGARGGAVSLAGTTITIQPLTWVMEGKAAPTTQGPYWGAFMAGDAQLTKTLTAAHATLNRTDVVRIRQYDPEAVPGESPNHGSVIEYVAGTPGSGTPAPPTPPANSTTYTLATIFVPANNTAGAVVTNTARPYGSPLQNDWTAFTPTWKSPGGTMDIGSGTKTGRWKYAHGLVVAHYEITRAADTNLGTGAYSYVLPVEARSFLAITGHGIYRDASPFTEYGLSVLGTSSTECAVLINSTNGRASNTHPVTPATSDVYTFTAEYEPLVAPL
jgi:hypothetical protein